MRTIDQMVQQEVLCCVSALVGTLATASAMRQSAIDASPAAWELFNAALELSFPIDDYEEAARQAGWTQQPDGRWWREPTEDEVATEDDALDYFCGSGPFVYVASAADACDRDGIDPYPWEVLEHWVVTDWFADKLIAAGEKVDKDFSGLCVWARTTSGQAIASDAVIKGIYASTHAAEPDVYRPRSYDPEG